ncbi:MAG TPA: oligosaccharide flippase family protein [Beijerinckiaceae bacterium]|nr:hypothetical protein [Hyphomonas sp.]HRJ68445.1 oligosaccharide flippase family protein [Beijerinckiaceae bacterium]
MNVRFVGYFLAGALPKLAMFLALFLLARHLDPAETGLFVLVITLGEVIEMTAGTWLRIYVLKAEAGRKTIGPYRVGRFLVLALAMLAMALLVSLPIAAIIAPGRFWTFAGATCAYIAAFAALRHAHTVLQILESHVVFILAEIARSLLIVACVLGSLATWPTSFVAPSLLVSAATAATAVISLLLVASRLHGPRFTLAGIQPAVIFGAPIIADVVMSLVIINFDRFVLNQMIGPAAVGIYALAYALGRQPIEFIAGPLNTYALPVLFAGYEHGGEERARQILTGLCITLFILCAAVLTGITLLEQPIANVALRMEYRDAAGLLMPVITFAACLLVFKAFIFDNVFHMLQKNDEKLASVALATGVGVAATILLVYVAGINGAAAALVLSSGVGLAASVYVSRRFFVFAIPLRHFAMIALAASGSGVALSLASWAVSAYGDGARIGAGFLAFCLCYALMLKLQGISLKALASTPWEPFDARTGSERRPSDSNLR